MRIGLYVTEGVTVERLELWRPTGNERTSHSDPLWYWRSRSRVNPETGCWEFQGAHDRDGYGQARRNGVIKLAHVGAWEAANGRRLRKGEVMMHACDNPPCCNPEHLSPGTQADNMADARTKGRLATGSRNGRAKLTEAQRQEILDSDASREELAAAYSVTERTIDRVRSGGRLQAVLAPPGHPSRP